jgi:hypothetical protein
MGNFTPLRRMKRKVRLISPVQYRRCDMASCRQCSYIRLFQRFVFKSYIFIISAYYIQYFNINARLDILTTVIVKTDIIWDITPCSSLEANRRFGMTCLYLQGRIIRRMKTSMKKVTLKMEAILSSKHRLTFNGLRDVIFQKFQYTFLIIQNILPFWPI